MEDDGIDFGLNVVPERHCSSGGAKRKKKNSLPQAFFIGTKNSNTRRTIHGAVVITDAKQIDFETESLELKAR